MSRCCKGLARSSVPWLTIVGIRAESTTAKASRGPGMATASGSARLEGSRRGPVVKLIIGWTQAIVPASQLASRECVGARSMRRRRFEPKIGHWHHRHHHHDTIPYAAASGKPARTGQAAGAEPGRLPCQANPQISAQYLLESSMLGAAPHHSSPAPAAARAMLLSRFRALSATGAAPRRLHRLITTRPAAMKLEIHQVRRTAIP